MSKDAILQWLTERLTRARSERYYFERALQMNNPAPSSLLIRDSQNELRWRALEYEFIIREFQKASLPCGYCGGENGLPHNHLLPDEVSDES
jgi:hypothetical protein